MESFILFKKSTSDVTNTYKTVNFTLLEQASTIVMYVALDS